MSWLDDPRFEDDPWWVEHQRTLDAIDRLADQASITPQRAALELAGMPAGQRDQLLDRVRRP